MFYLIDKPAGVSSHAAIKDFARLVKAQKIGHAGTLDPFATGLLLVATDADTPLISYAERETKTYEVHFKLGARSATDDLTGELTFTNAPIPGAKQIAHAIYELTQVKSQVPPIYSAKQVSGQRAYLLARKGLTPDLKPISVLVSSVVNISALTSSEWTFTCTVSRGTYVRALVRDLGEALQCGAYTTALRRVAIGELDLKLVNKPLLAKQVITLPTLCLDEHEALMHGRLDEVLLADGLYALTRYEDIVGVAKVTNNVAQAVRILGAKLFT